MDKSNELCNKFDESNHLRPEIDKLTFDALRNWDLGWALLEPINIASDNEKEKQLAVKLSPGQKAIYFFWYLDAQVTNGGFIQFYWNGYRKYSNAITEGLKLIGDKALLELLEQADQQYLNNKEEFELQRKKNTIEPLYEHLTEFDKLDQQYYKIHNNTIALIEKYARQHPTQFAKLK